MLIKYKKIRKVTAPELGTPLSAGVDLFVPEFNDKFIIDFGSKNDPLESTLLSNPKDEKIALYPHCKVLIPSGIVFNMTTTKEQYDNQKFVLVAHNKSGVSSKYGLDVLACVIDEDYQGEVHISLVNTGTKTVYIYPGDKIVQLIPMAIPQIELKQADDDEILFYRNNERGTGGFGSTNKQQ